MTHEKTRYGLECLRNDNTSTSPIIIAFFHFVAKALGISLVFLPVIDLMKSYLGKIENGHTVFVLAQTCAPRVFSTRKK